MHRSSNRFVRHPKSEAFCMRLFADRDRNMGRELADPVQGRKEISLRIVLGRTFCRDGMSGSEKHAVGYASRARRDRAEPYAGIDIGIVRLINVENLAVALQRWKWATGANDGSTLRPAVKVCRHGLAALRGVRERENDRTLHMAGHVTHDPFGEGVRLA